MAKKEEKGGLMLPILIVLVVFILLGSAGFVAYKYSTLKPDGQTEENQQNKEQNQVACTQEAKQCPDGSFVSRTGPNCEFAECKDETLNPVLNGIEGWKIYTGADNLFEFKYPEDFWGEQDLKIYQKDCNYENFSGNCPEAKNIISQELKNQGITDFAKNISFLKVNFSNNLFCLYSYKEGAAGTTYESSFYAIAKNKKCVIINFVTPYPNCQNYLPLEQGNTEQEKNYNNCLKQNQEKPKTLEKIIQTFKFLN